MRLLGVLRHLRSDALARGLDLLAQLVVFLRERRLDGVGGILHALRGLAVQLLALGRHVVDDLLALGRGLVVRLLHVAASLRAKLLGLAPHGVHFIGDHGPRFLTRTGRAQKRDDRARKPSGQEST